MEHTAIVLRIYKPGGYRVALFEQQIGRFDAIVSNGDKIMLGSVITCWFKKDCNNYLIEKWQLQESPHAVATIDISFFHHILELIDHFVPHGAQAGELFNELVYLYKSNVAWAAHTILQKIFLCKILFFIGLYTPKQQKDLLFIHSLLVQPIDIIDPQSLHLAQEQAIDRWLQQYIYDHPDICNFKTVHFLIKNRIV